MRFSGLGVATTVFALLAPLGVEHPGTASQPPETHAIERQFETRNGTVNLSGIEDGEGNVRISAIQIMRANDAELKVIDPDSGKTTIWQFTNSRLQMTYSLPTGNQFYRLKIQRKERSGIRTLDYLLGTDRIHYQLVRNRFEKYRKFNWTADDCPPNSVNLIGKNQGNLAPAIDALVDKSSAIAANMLDESCKKEPFSKDGGMIQASLAEVISSGARPAAMNGDFLSCLKAHHLSEVASNLDVYFNSKLSKGTDKSVFCKVGAKGELGSYLHEVTTFLEPPSANSSSRKDRIIYYADVFFHESLHRVGLGDEDLVVDLTSCCGLGRDDKSATACKNVENRVAAINKRNSQLIAMANDLKGFHDLWGQVEQASDGTRTDVFFDDYIASVQHGGKDSMGAYTACIQSGKTSDTDCSKTYLSTVEASLQDFFTPKTSGQTQCTDFFPRKNKDDPDGAKKFCQQLLDESKKIVETNAKSDCNPNGKTSLERSCLFKIKTDQNDILKNGSENIIAEPNFYDNSKIDEKETKKDEFRRSYLAAFTKYFPGTAQLFDGIIEKTSLSQTQDLFYLFVRTSSRAVRDAAEKYGLCTKSGNDVSRCADETKKSIFSDVDAFFQDGKGCGTLFDGNTDSTQHPCDVIKKRVEDLLQKSLDGKCPIPPGVKKVGSTNTDLTCLFEAYKEGKDNYINFDEKKNQLPTIKEMSFKAPTESQIQAAQDVGKSDPASPTDSSPGKRKARAFEPSNGNKQDAANGVSQDQKDPDSSGTEGLARAPTQFDTGPSYHSSDNTNYVKSNDPGAWDKVERDISDSSTLKDWWKQAEDAANDAVGIQNAQAQTTGGGKNSTPQTTGSPNFIDPSNGGRPSNPPAAPPQANTPANLLPPPGYGTPGGLPGAMPGVAPPGTSGAGPQSGNGTASSASASSSSNSNSAASPPQGGAGNVSSSSPGGGASNRSSRGGGGGSGIKKKPNTGGSELGQDFGDDTEEPVSTRQTRIFTRFREHPDETLEVLRTGNLDADLGKAFISAIDDQRTAHPSHQDRVDYEIKYDKETHTFFGIPEESRGGNP